MSEVIYVEYLYADGTRSATVPEIHERLASDIDGSFVSDVNPESADRFRFEADTSDGDVSIEVRYAPPDEHEWFPWPRVELYSGAGSLHDNDIEPDAPRCRAFVDVARAVYLATSARPDMVYGCSMNQGKTQPPVEGDLTSERSYLTWLDVFTPDEVGTVGRDRLLSAPASRVEELADGSVLVCSDHPLQREGVGRLADVAGHLEIPHWLEYLHS